MKAVEIKSGLGVQRASHVSLLLYGADKYNDYGVMAVHNSIIF
jgi:hypothetical protein